MIERYLQIRAATVAGHLPSGELGYLADVTGLLQLWRVAPDGLHEQVTFGKERITAALASPGEERWVIARDAGGNERHALFSVDAAGSSELALSHDPEAIHVPGAFSPDGRQVAFTHTGRNGVDFDVAVVDVSGGPSRELAQPGGWAHVVDWSQHGILVHRANTPFDHDLYLVDAESGELTHLTPHDGEVAYDSACLLPDGRGAVRVRRRERVHAAGRAAARRRARAADARRRRRRDRRPGSGALAPGLGDQPRRRERGLAGRGAPRGPAGRRRLGAGVRTRRLAHGHRRPARRFHGRVDGRARPWPGARARLSAGSTARASCGRCWKSVESFDGRRIPYLRFGAAGRPALCWVHGGPESQFRPQMAPVIQYLCSQGITVAAPNVRGSTGYGRSYHHLDDVERRLDSVADLAALGRALGAGAGTAVGVMGGSYGGYMTMAAITEHPELWACAVNIVGIVNFVTFLERTGAYRRALREAEYGSLERDREFLESISPIRKIDRIACPLMVIHGANDPRVPVSEAEQVVAALEGRGAPVEYLRYDDEGHGITRLPNRLDCYPRVAAFLQRHLLSTG